jgi:hypothetical protein
VSDDDSVTRPSDGAEDAADVTDVGSVSTPRARAPWERKDPKDEVRHSALVGFMSVPVARRFPLRRSTLLMAVAFIGLATVLYFYPPQSSTDTGSGVVLHTPQGDVFVPNATPVSTTTTTATTTAPPATTTTVVPSPTTTVFSTTPSTFAPKSTTTTTTTTTTTVPGGGSAATTTTSGGFGSTTTSAPR